MKVYDLDDPQVAHARGRPVPQPDRVSAPFWAAVARGELVVQRCDRCRRHQFYPRPLCIRCAGDVDWVELDGRGEVHTYTVIRQNLAEPFAGLRPYVVAMIALPAGPRMLSNITDCLPEAVAVGLPVHCYAVRVAPEIGIPFWRPGPHSLGNPHS